MNAFWDSWRKQLAFASVPSRVAVRDPQGLGPALLEELRRVLAPVTRPCAAIGLAGAATSPTQSFLTGHPYLPAGVGWPEGSYGPQLFVGQLNFAEIGPARPFGSILPPGFPAAGLLQWFIDPDESWGMAEAADSATRGFTVRWYPQPDDPTSPGPDAPTPHDGHDDPPMEFVGPTALEFTPSLSTPGWEELPPTVQADGIWDRIAIALGERNAEPDFLYREYLRGSVSPLHDHRAGSKIGGYPSFSQTDPRGTGGYPAVGTGRAELIIELDSLDVGGWGDSGVAHLFGDPVALAAGDTASVRYHWDSL